MKNENLQLNRCRTIMGSLILFAGVQLTTAAETSLDNLNILGVGNRTFTADGQTFDAYVEQKDGVGWLLVGRGRNGWQFDNDGQGAVTDVKGHGTSSHFAPAMYSDDIINDLITNTGIDLLSVEIRLKRASDPAGTDPYQEVRWRPQALTAWTGEFDIGGTGYNVQQEIVSGPEVHGPVLTNTRDQLPAVLNTSQRAFTWAWAGHGNQQGFSYGNIAYPGANNGTNFLWENAGENHALPYTELYIRYDGAALGRLAAPEPTTAVTIVFGTCLLTFFRRARRESDARKFAATQDA